MRSCRCSACRSGRNVECPLRPPHSSKAQSDYQDRHRLAPAQRHGGIVDAHRNGVAPESPLVQDFNGGALGKAEFDQAPLQLARGQSGGLVADIDGIDPPAEPARGMPQRRSRGWLGGVTVAGHHSTSRVRKRKQLRSIRYLCPIYVRTALIKVKSKVYYFQYLRIIIRKPLEAGTGFKFRHPTLSARSRLVVPKACLLPKALGNAAGPGLAQGSCSHYVPVILKAERSPAPEPPPPLIATFFARKSAKKPTKPHGRHERAHRQAPRTTGAST